MTEGTSTISTRLFVSHEGAEPIPGWPGLVVVGVEPSNGLAPLLVVFDEMGRNAGVSATDAIPVVLQFLEHAWAADFPIRQALVVVRDAAADYDHAIPNWSESPFRGEFAPSIAWQPVTWPGTEMRSRMAFEAVFESTARAALKGLCKQLMLPQPDTLKAVF